MKIVILTNQRKKLEKALQEFKKSQIGGDIEIRDYFFTVIGREAYTPTYPDKFGIKRSYIDMLSYMYAYADVIVVHYPEFKVQGAGGWHSVVNSRSVIQIYDQGDVRASLTGEFEYWFAELLTHELCHHLYRQHGLKDNTHEWHYDKKSLLGAVDEIKIHLKKKVGLMEEIVRLTRKAISLLGAKIDPPQEEIVKKNYIKEWALAIQEYEGWKEGSLTYRHNNPGALRWSKYQIDHKNGFSVFASYEDGFRALEFQLKIATNGQSSVYFPDDTLLQFFEKYAPSSDNNNPKAYAQFVANKLGVGIDIKIKELV